MFLGNKMASESGNINYSIESLKNKIKPIIQNYKMPTESMTGNLRAIAHILFQNLHTMKQAILEKRRKNSEESILDFKKLSESHIRDLREDKDLAINPTFVRNGSHAGTSSSTEIGFGDESANFSTAVVNEEVEKSISEYIAEMNTEIENLSDIQVFILQHKESIQILIGDLYKKIKRKIVYFQAAEETNVDGWKNKINKAPQTKIVLQEILRIIESTYEKMHSIISPAIRHLEIEADKIFEKFLSELTTSIDTIQMEIVFITDELRKAIKMLIDDLKIETGLEMGHLQLEVNGVLETLFTETELMVKEFRHVLETSIQNIKEELEAILKAIQTTATEAMQNLNEQFRTFLDYCEKDFKRGSTGGKQ